MEQEIELVDCIATAGSIIKARLAKHQELLDAELQKLPIHVNNASKIRVNGNWFFEKLDDICKSDLEAAAQIIFQTLEQNLIGPDICSPSLNQRLKMEFSAH